MITPYVPHYFGQKVEDKLRSRLGWLTAGVASSIPWPKSDIWLVYNSDDYIIRGTERNGKPSPPGITIACDKDQIDFALGKVLRFTSILSWFKGGYVDVSGYIYGSHPITYGAQNVFSNIGLATDKSFNCNYLPIVDDESVRKSLAFWREGCRLMHVSDSYSFLSFYKVIESQFSDGNQRAKWIKDNIDFLAGDAAARVAELNALGLNVSEHIFKSGRCAIAHASLDGEIVDPDIPADRRAIYEDLDVIKGLASRYISNVLQVPDDNSLYKLRNRLEPLFSIIPQSLLNELISGEDPSGIDILNDHHVSVGIWPDGPYPELERMPFQLIGVENGLIKFRLENVRRTIRLEFILDFPNGRAHTQLQATGLIYKNLNVTEEDVVAYTTYFNRVFGNQIVELHFDGCDPVDCEIVIPMNMMPLSLEDALKNALQKHRVLINRKIFQFF